MNPSLRNLIGETNEIKGVEEIIFKDNEE